MPTHQDHGGEYNVAAFLVSSSTFGIPAIRAGIENHVFLPLSDPAGVDGDDKKSINTPLQHLDSLTQLLRDFQFRCEFCDRTIERLNLITKAIRNRIGPFFLDLPIVNDTLKNEAVKAYKEVIQELYKLEEDSNRFVRMHRTESEPATFTSHLNKTQIATACGICNKTLMHWVKKARNQSLDPFPESGTGNRGVFPIGAIHNWLGLMEQHGIVKSTYVEAFRKFYRLNDAEDR